MSPVTYMMLFFSLFAIAMLIQRRRNRLGRNSRA